MWVIARRMPGIEAEARRTPGRLIDIQTFTVPRLPVFSRRPANRTTAPRTGFPAATTVSR